MNIRSLLLAIAMLPFALAPAQAADPLPGLYFAHGDWELACDNTGICRAAGYQAEQDKQAISVLLTRKAGAGQQVSGELLLGQIDSAAQRQAPLTLALQIDGARAGAVVAGEAPATLSPQVVTALLGALPRTASIAWSGDSQRWQLSGAGAAAVLLKMDEFQGRVGTTGALIKPGRRSEGVVPAATAAPRVNAVRWAASLPRDSERFAGPQASVLRDALRTTLLADADYCPDVLDASAQDAEPLSVWRLDAKRLLVSTRCYLGAYNIGYGFWVIERNGPFNPVLVTATGSEAESPAILADRKGRGVGDCRSSDTWTWDGSRFVHTASSTTGLCKMVAAGGAWDLPRIVTEVRSSAPAALSGRR